ncbi:hypothetical protein GCM10017673_49900 [Streptosporangium violaceochromogenes]|nr:hypothetical protein GCM10017673_49900 [Streptosporangium violaceochromogenes]
MSEPRETRQSEHHDTRQSKSRDTRQGKSRDTRRPAPYRKVHPVRFWVFCALAAVALGSGIVVVFRAPARVTDGSGDHPAGISPIMELIRQENERVRGQAMPYVSVAVMLPLRQAPGRRSEGTAIRHALQGAYLAQYWSNHIEGEASAPNVQLLVADSSGGEDAWKATVRELKELASGQEHLVAVTGLGSSLTETAETIDDLATAKIAMVGAVMTSDKLQGKATLVRVAPPNSAQARAITHFLASRGAVHAVMVQDTTEGTSYPATLATSFASAFKEVVASKREGNLLERSALTYSSALDSADTVLAQMPEQICARGANVIFYAGLWRNLPPFLSALTERRCLNRKITVVTGDDASHLIDPLHPERLWDDAQANLEVYYTALAHPGAWDDRSGAVQPAVAALFQRGKDSFATRFPEESLDDGQAIMHHDAMLTAVKAVDIFAARGNTRPSASAIANMLGPLISVPGASGWISFDKQGNPVNKAIPIVRIAGDGTTAFSVLTSETGHPPKGPLAPGAGG